MTVGVTRPGCSGRWAKVACAYDNSLIESFCGSMQIELLDRRRWPTRADLANAIFKWIGAFYNPSAATPGSATSHRSTTR